uniref:protein stum homolog isoform X1 n=1 Tax=Halichoerus grypus TaxID=9711 RepID=UPI001658E013|nr:protein stum homolog isoform X1 [Halichoerus grypus]
MEPSHKDAETAAAAAAAAAAVDPRAASSSSGVVVQVREKKGPLRAAIPYMPFPVAVICLFLNTFVPGLGSTRNSNTATQRRTSQTPRVAELPISISGELTRGVQERLRVSAARRWMPGMCTEQGRVRKCARWAQSTPRSGKGPRTGPSTEVCGHTAAVDLGQARTGPRSPRQEREDFILWEETVSRSTTTCRAAQRRGHRRERSPVGPRAQRSFDDGEPRIQNFCGECFPESW